MRVSGRVRRRLLLGCSLVLLAAIPTALAATGGAGAATAAPALGNFVCYTAAATATKPVPKPFPATPAKVTLTNQLATGAVAPGAVQLQCSPVQTGVTTNGHVVTTPIVNSAANLSCRALVAKAVSHPAAITLTNQFGTGAVLPTAARSLCLPSWENATAPSGFPKAPAPANLDAYACFTAVHPKGAPAFKVPSSVKLQNQFGATTAGVGAPDILCVPSKDAFTGSPATKIVDPAHYSVCFVVPPAKTAVSRTLFDKNRFGIGTVKIGRATQLCVPSVRAVVPPTTTTSTTTPPSGFCTTPAQEAPVTTTMSGTIAMTDFKNSSISSPIDIVTGSDGALWFTNYGNNSIGRISPDGTVMVCNYPGISRPDGIAAGPDGALWFTNAGNNSIGRITTAGAVTNFSDTSISSPYDIAEGSDGAMWFTNYATSSIGRITTDGKITNYAGTGISFPDGIAAGYDGALWFANTGASSIGRIATDGTVTNYSDASISTPYRITAGPDGAMWFTNSGNELIGRVTTGGPVTNYPAPENAGAQGITAAPDGALWYVNWGNSSVGRITTNGTVTNYTNPNISLPFSITVGPDGALWFTNSGNNSIGRIGL